MISRILHQWWQALREWWERHIVAPDPHVPVEIRVRPKYPIWFSEN